MLFFVKIQNYDGVVFIYMIKNILLELKDAISRLVFRGWVPGLLK
jgi:hypothetical protein